MKHVVSFISIFIMITVFSVVALSAGWTIKRSFTSSTSNYKVASNFMQGRFKIVTAASLEEALKISCDTLINPSGNDSIVDFLNANDMDSSFTARSKLAIEAGITNYHGFYGDNGVLLQYLIRKFIKENNCQTS